jgi:hypothetical protein
MELLVTIFTVEKKTMSATALLRIVLELTGQLSDEPAKKIPPSLSESVLPATHTPGPASKMKIPVAALPEYVFIETMFPVTVPVAPLAIRIPFSALVNTGPRPVTVFPAIVHELPAESQATPAF